MYTRSTYQLWYSEHCLSACILTFVLDTGGRIHDWCEPLDGQTVSIYFRKFDATRPPAKQTDVSNCCAIVKVTAMKYSLCASVILRVFASCPGDERSHTLLPSRPRTNVLPTIIRASRTIRQFLFIRLPDISDRELGKCLFGGRVLYTDHPSATPLLGRCPHHHARRCGVIDRLHEELMWKQCCRNGM